MKTQSVSLSRTEQAAKLQCHKLAKKIWPRHYVWIEYDSRAPESNEARVAAREATAAINAEREAHSKQLLPEGQRVAEFEAVIAAAEFVRDLPGDPTAAANGGRRPFLQPGDHSLPDQGKDHAIRRDQR